MNVLECAQVNRKISVDYCTTKNKQIVSEIHWHSGGVVKEVQAPEQPSSKKQKILVSKFLNGGRSCYFSAKHKMRLLPASV